MLSRGFLDYVEGLASVSVGPKAATFIAHGSFRKVSLNTNQRPPVDGPVVCDGDGAVVVSMVALSDTRSTQSKACVPTAVPISMAVVRLNENNFGTAVRTRDCYDSATALILVHRVAQQYTGTRGSGLIRTNNSFRQATYEYRSIPLRL